MRILFLKPYPDPYNPTRTYQPGWVAEFTDADGQRAIDAGVAELAPPGALSRKGAAPSLECAVVPPFAPTGKTTDLGGLVEGETYTSKEVEEAEKRRGEAFPTAMLDYKKPEIRKKDGGFFGKK